MRWIVSDFKGLREAELDLTGGKITVLAGINSSGKSSIVQSLLMFAQSLYHDGAIVLNGPLVRLGQASDLVREGADEGSVRFSIEFDTADDEGTESIRVDIDLAPSEDDTSLTVLKLTAVGFPGAGVAQPLTVDRKRARSSDATEAIFAAGIRGVTDALHIKTLLASDRRALRTYVAFSGVVPRAVVQLRTPEEISSRYQKVLDPILSAVAEETRHSGLRDIAEAESVPIAREFAQLLAQAVGDDDATRRRFRGVLYDRGWFSARFRDAWRDLDQGSREEAIRLASSIRAETHVTVLPLDERLRRPGGSPRGALEIALAEELGESLKVLRSLTRSLLELGDRVQYLGPLRDEPRVVWNQWNELTRGLPVGTRGEYSAAVLTRSRERRIPFVSPEGVLGMGSLGEAVDAWLGYLQIGDAVVTNNRGKLGVGMEISLQGARRDLTAVGVGVSQALPLVVGLLVAPAASIFLVEQPELHLHPAVQARLADFIARARPDVTVVVETHSEALITRIRRRVAEEQIDPNRVGIVFVEPTTEGTVTRALRLTEFGDLSDWPAGFLTLPDEDTSAILQANLKRLSASDR
ncbi:AAA family ATPase [Micromonospora sp. DT81.3]|uniref:AAA family ATPase n=1 Tax=Micromonospora sp. DT81.3 TaxID=3416523 RepID=UPI003CF24E63